MELLTTIYRSIFDLDWLGAQQYEKAKAWSYAFLFLLAATILHFGSLLWTVPKIVNEASMSFTTAVPDFQATFAHGTLAVTGLDQPFVRDITSDETHSTVLRIVVDTTSTTTPSVETYRVSDMPLILVTAHGVTNVDTVRAQTESWDRITATTTITRGQITAVVDRLAGTVGYFVAPVVIVAIYVGTLVGAGLHVALIALLVWLISLAMKRNWTYGQVYTIGLFAMTAPILLGLLLDVAGFPIPFVNSILMGAIMLSAIARASRPTIPPHDHTHE
jgi:hypothetical protein